MNEAEFDRLQAKATGIPTPAPLEGVVPSRRRVIWGSRHQENAKATKDAAFLELGVPKKIKVPTHSSVLKTNIDSLTGKTLEKVKTSIKKSKA